MNFIKSSILNPVVVCVGILFVFLFGILAFFQLPYQLLPKVTYPVVSVYTSWSNASPYEIESEILIPQEKVLKSIQSLKNLNSIAREGRGSITLEFKQGVDINAVLLQVSQKLDEIRNYPSGVSRPSIKASGESIPPSIYLFLESLDPKVEVQEERAFFVEKVAPLLERIKGVGEVSVWGGRNTQMQILLDTKLLVYNNITIAEVIDSISKTNKDTSAGVLDYSARSYRIRVKSKFKSLEDIYNSVLTNRDGRVVYLRDIAQVQGGYAKTQVYSFHNQKDAISVRIYPSAFANILELTNAIEQEVQRINEEILQKKGLKLAWSRDQRGYILESIALVQQNILYGIVFAGLVLFVFLRSMSSVFVVAFVIPVSVCGTFFVLQLFDRTLNIVSLAGISFAISMLVDNAIVVLENINQHHKRQKSLLNACIDGTQEVVGAIFASVLTTIAIFVPILGLKSESGQLFYDIALSATSALVISLVVSLFVVPMMIYQIQRMGGASFVGWRSQMQGVGAKIFKPFDWLGKKAVALIGKILAICLQSAIKRLLCIVGFIGLCGWMFVGLYPKIDYLPSGNQNFAIAYLSIPSGLSYQERKEIAHQIYLQNKDYLSESGYKPKTPKDPVAIKDLFFIGNESFMFIGALAQDPSRIKDLIKKLQKDIGNIPSVRGNVFQQGIFDGGNGGMSVDLYLMGDNLEKLRMNARKLMEKIKEKIPQTIVRAIPSLEVNNKEVSFYPDLQALSANGLDAKSFGEILSTILNGKKIGEFTQKDGDTMDLVLKSASYTDIPPESLRFAQVYTPLGNVVSLQSLATIVEEYGIAQIRRHESERSILLIAIPPKDMPLDEVLKTIKTEVLSEVDLEGQEVSLKGSADQLNQTKQELKGGLILAVVITYLLLCALYGDFFYPFVIIFTLPFAIVGGFLGIKLTNLYIAPQALDVLGMLGVIILVGSVVNNAILIVYQSLINIREYAQSPYNAVYNATLSRVRPIYMSMLTSVCALLPLVVFAGSGSEIYRGLGAVIVGGLAFSSIVSVFVIPALLLFFIGRETKKDTRESV
ncbi:hypothetical protein BBW65_00980 [Helicobacter enhydrae]|uniref:Acriflavin resistance protein n=1 Tax=Helicobacter enhydrae TaxID=222136 RepID=A0A1B1U3Y6_9HELI|nr:efflux RND transporter permease subunit [Helicobacter enhydrae]ANV97473.1 hypothetical protein BBW65_00980 [Helicobacter enhydrae]